MLQNNQVSQHGEMIYPVGVIRDTKSGHLENSPSNSSPSEAKLGNDSAVGASALDAALDSVVGATFVCESMSESIRRMRAIDDFVAKVPRLGLQVLDGWGLARWNEIRTPLCNFLHIPLEVEGPYSSEYVRTAVVSRLYSIGAAGPGLFQQDLRCVLDAVSDAVCDWGLRECFDSTELHVLESAFTGPYDDSFLSFAVAWSGFKLLLGHRAVREGEYFPYTRFEGFLEPVPDGVMWPAMYVPFFPIQRGDLESVNPLFNQSGADRVDIHVPVCVVVGLICLCLGLESTALQFLGLGGIFALAQAARLELPWRDLFSIDREEFSFENQSGRPDEVENVEDLPGSEEDSLRVALDTGGERVRDSGGEDELEEKAEIPPPRVDSLPDRTLSRILRGEDLVEEDGQINLTQPGMGRLYGGRGVSRHQPLDGEMAKRFGGLLKTQRSYPSYAEAREEIKRGEDEAPDDSVASVASISSSAGALLAELSSIQTDETVRQLINLALVVTNIARHSDLINVTTNLTLFINNLPSVGSVMREFLLRMIPKGEGFTNQGGSPADLPFTAVSSSPVFSAFMDLFGMLSFVTIFKEMELLPPQIMKLLDKVKSSLKKFGDVDTFILRVLRLIKLCGEVAVECIKQRSLEPLFGDTMTPEYWISVTECFLNDSTIMKTSTYYLEKDFQERRKDGSIPSFFVRRLETFEVLPTGRLILEHGEQIAHTYRDEMAKTVVLRNSFHSLLDKLKARVHELGNHRVNGQLRMEPFAIYMWGPVGCGKSVTLRSLKENAARKIGVPFSDEMTCSVVPGANFIDDYRPGQLFLDFDDVDQSTVAEGSTNYASQVIQLINNKATQIEAADVGKKGTQYAFFEMAMFASNHRSPVGLSSYINTPAAFHRRFKLNIEAKANPLCANAVGGIDRSAVGALPKGEPVTQYRIAVQKFKDACKPPPRPDGRRVDKTRKNPDPEDDWPFEYITQWVDKRTMLQTVMEHFVAHREEQRQLLDKLLEEKQACQYCGINIQDHDVPCVEVAGAVNQAGGSPPLPWYWGALLLMGLYIPSTQFVTWVTLVMLALSYFDPTNFQKLKTLMLVLTRWAFTVWTPWWARLEMMILTPTNYRRVAEFARLERQAKIKAFSEIAGNRAMQLGFVAVALTTALTVYYKKAGVKVVRNQYLVESPERDNLFGTGAGNWLSITSTKPLSPHVLDSAISKGETVSKESIFRAISSRMVTLVHGENKVWAFRYRSNVVVTVAHLFLEGKHADGRTLAVPASGQFNLTVRGSLGPTNLVVSVPFSRVEKVPGKDLVLIYLPQLFPLTDRTRELCRPPPETMASVTGSFDEGFLIKTKSDGTYDVVCLEGYMAPRFVRQASLIGSQKPRLVYGEVTEDGDCGSVLAVRLKKSILISGMHNMVATIDRERFSAAEELVESELDLAFERLQRRCGVMEAVLDTSQLSGDDLLASSEITRMENQVRRVDTEVELTDIPPKRSSLLAANRWREGSFPYEVLGTLKKFRASKMKTGITRSRLHSRLLTLEREILGKNGNFGLPTFKGEKVQPPLSPEPDMWIDSYQRNFCRMENRCLDALRVGAAVADFCRGMRDVPGWGYIRPATPYEAYAGVPGVIKPENLRTSVGIPFNRQKKHHIKVVGPDEIMVDRCLTEQVSAIFSAWRRGMAYVPFSNHTEKDEVMSAEKVANHAERIYNTLGEAINVATKMLLGPLVAHMLKNREFFECYGLISMVSTQVDDLMERFDSVDPDRVRRIAGDFETFDMREDTEILLGVRDVFVEAAKCCGWGEDLLTMVAACVVSFVYTVRIVKGDLVAMSFTNPSGCFLTLIINSLANSLYFRFAYLSLGLPYPFRQVVKLSTVGDDNAAAVAEEAGSFNQTVLARELSKLGQNYTGCDKKKIVEEWTPFESVTFLRRGFCYDSALQRWKAPLDKKSIVRMLLYTKPREVAVSLDEQESAILDTALREAYLHGREFYNSLEGALRAAVGSDAIMTSARWPSYEKLEADFVGGRLAQWEVVPFIVCVDLAEFSNQSGIDLGPVAEISTPSATDVAGSVSAAEVGSHSVGDAGSLDHFLFRAALVHMGSLAHTDVVGAKIFSTADVMEDYITLPHIAAKLQHAQALRGDMEIVVEVTSSALIQGHYVVAATPMLAGSCGGPLATPINENLNMYNCYQGIHGIINCTTSQHVRLTLPWISEFNYYSMESGVGTPGYRLEVYCIVPAQNVNDPAAPAKASFKIYGRFLEEGFELAIPTNQGKKAKKHDLAPKPRGPLGQGVSLARQVVDVVAKIPGAGAMASVVGTGLSVAQTVADALGWTKEQSEKDPMPVRLAGLSNIATTDGTFSGTMVGMSGGNNVTISASLGGGDDDDAEFSSLFQRQTLIGRATWSATTPAETCLLSIPVMPGYCASGTGLTGIQPTVPGGLGSPFKFWSGSMEYEIITVTNSFARGSLQVVWTPSEAPPTTNAVGLTWNYIFDVDPNSSHVFRVHWSSVYPALLNTLTPSITPGEAYCNGYLHIMVNTALSMTSAASCKVLVLASGGSDLQFSVPRARINASTTFRYWYEFTNQKGLGDGMIECDGIDLTAPTSAPNLAVVLGGEVVGSVRQLLQKASWVCSYTMGLGTTETDVYVSSTVRIPFYPNPPSLDFTPLHPGKDSVLAPMNLWWWTWFGFYSSMYSGVLGSIRVWAYVRKSHWASASAAFEMSASDGEGPYLIMRTDVAAPPLGFSQTDKAKRAGLDMPGFCAKGPDVLEQGVEITFPYYDRFKFRSNYLCLPRAASSPFARWLEFNVQWYKQYMGSSELELFQAGGADIKPINFLRVWPLQFRSVPVSIVGDEFSHENQSGRPNEVENVSGCCVVSSKNRRLSLARASSTHGRVCSLTMRVVSMSLELVFAPCGGGNFPQVL